MSIEKHPATDHGRISLAEAARRAKEQPVDIVDEDQEDQR